MSQENEEVGSKIRKMMGDDPFVFVSEKSLSLGGSLAENLAMSASLARTLLEQSRAPGYRRHVVTVIMSALSTKFSDADLLCIASADTDNVTFVRWLSKIAEEYDYPGVA